MKEFYRKKEIEENGKIGKVILPRSRDKEERQKKMSLSLFPSPREHESPEPSWAPKKNLERKVRRKPKNNFWIISTSPESGAKIQNVPNFFPVAGKITKFPNDPKSGIFVHKRKF